MQKGVFYNAKEHVLKSIRGINLTKGDITSNRQNVLLGIFHQVFRLLSTTHEPL